jgi:hypothetical protein
MPAEIVASNAHAKSGFFQPNAQVAFENIRKRSKQAENIRKLAPFV